MENIHFIPYHFLLISMVFNESCCYVFVSCLDLEVGSGLAPKWQKTQT